jgi:hypothetical protein
MRVLAVTTLLAAACGSTPAPRTANAPSPSASPSSATPSPTATPATNPCPPPSNRCLALVTLRGSSSYVVRDITDINHPKTVSNLGAIPPPVFLSATELSFADSSGFVRVPLAGSPKTVVAKPDQVMLFAWSPDGNSAAYITNGTDKSDLHLVTAGRDRVASSMAPFNGGCETQACADGSDFRLAYSQDGHFISLVQPWGGPNFQLWNSDGKLLKSNVPGTGYRMSTWSANGLYAVGPDGVAVWRNAAVSSFLPGVSWIRPKGSSAGGLIVYEVRDKTSLAHVYVVDTATKKVRELKAARSEPAFLTSRYIWYRGERRCVAVDNCDPNFPVVSNGKTYIYDLQTGTQSESIITSVSDVWPHAA